MALPHLVHPGRNGYLFPPGDVRALTLATFKALDLHTAGHPTALTVLPPSHLDDGKRAR
ncbi:hypothetical protein OG542_38420 [Streptomyces violaceus]|uniref:hypothetical protein n=1 Tax=Streptomyces TaxID=1883 RepID=UPI002E24F977